MFPIMSRAMVAHLCGLGHPFLLSVLHALHVQLLLQVCLELCLINRLLALISSFMLTILCFVFRQCVRVLWYLPGGTPMWYHAGSFLFRDLDSFLGAKVSLCFFAVFRRVATDLGVCGPVLLVWPEGRSVVRNVFTSAC